MLLYSLEDPGILAAALKANAYQVNQLIKSYLAADAGGEYFTYSELWKITIINYHAGATITAAALDQMLQRGDQINYANYYAAMQRIKPTAIEYLRRVILGH